jgi:hypothetical protein
MTKLADHGFARLQRSDGVNGMPMRHLERPFGAWRKPVLRGWTASNRRVGLRQSHSSVIRIIAAIPISPGSPPRPGPGDSVRTSRNRRPNARAPCLEPVEQTKLGFEVSTIAVGDRPERRPNSGTGRIVTAQAALALGKVGRRVGIRSPGFEAHEQRNRAQDGACHSKGSHRILPLARTLRPLFPQRRRPLDGTWPDRQTREHAPVENWGSCARSNPERAAGPARAMGFAETRRATGPQHGIAGQTRSQGDGSDLPRLCG